MRGGELQAGMLDPRRITSGVHSQGPSGDVAKRQTTASPPEGIDSVCVAVRL